MPADSSGKRIVVGRITAVYGVKGWVKVHSYTSPPENIFNYQPWYLAQPAGAQCETWPRPVKLAEYRPHGKGFVASIEGIEDRDQASLLCQKEIETELEALPPLPEGEYYWQQLTGLKVYTVADAGNVLLGTVRRMIETGANDVIEVAPCDGSVDSKTRLLPYVPDRYVKDIDLATGIMTVDWGPDF